MLYILYTKYNKKQIFNRIPVNQKQRTKKKEKKSQAKKKGKATNV